MTTAVKIHLPAPGKPKGTTLCGRKAKPERITDEIDSVTCDVCITTRIRQSGGTGPARKTVIDRLVDGTSPAPTAIKRRTTSLGEDSARSAASEALIARHLDEFLELYREALEAGRTT